MHDGNLIKNFRLAENNIYIFHNMARTSTVLTHIISTNEATSVCCPHFQDIIFRLFFLAGKMNLDIKMVLYPQGGLCYWDGGAVPILDTYCYGVGGVSI